MALARIGELRERRKAAEENKAREDGRPIGGSTESIAGIDTNEVVEDSDVKTPDINPFIDGIQFAWDATSLSYIKRCPRLYFYIMKEGWRSKKESPHLRFGGEFHRCAEDYHKLMADGIKHDEAVFHVVKGLLYRIHDWESEHKYKNKEFLVRTVIWWLAKRPEDHVKTYILPSGKPAIELNFNFELTDFPDAAEGQPYVLCGRLDRLVMFDGDILDEDYKTTTMTPGPYYWDTFDPDPQMSMYTLAPKICFEPQIKGVLITSAQIMMEGTRFTRGITYRTQEQLNEWVNDLRWVFAAAKGYTIAEYWPMNDTACDKYGGCMFRGVCSKSPQVRELYLNANFEKGEIWNPLKNRE